MIRTAAATAPQSVGMENTKRAQHADVIYILGPDSEPDEHMPVLKACEARGLSFHLVGDGSKHILKSDIVKLHRSKLIGPDTHVFVSGHGLKKATGHTILGDKTGGDLSTVYLISALLTDPDEAAASGARPGSGVIHIMSCQAGYLKTEFTPTNKAWTKGSCLIHATKKNTSVVTTLPNAIAVVELLADCRDNGSSVPDPQLVFAKVAAMTGESITLLGGTLEEPQTWHAPKNEQDVRFQNTLALKLQLDLNEKFRSRQEGAGKVENKDDNSYTNKVKNTFRTRIQRGKEGPARELLAQNPFLAQAPFIAGSNSLMHASQEGHLDLVRDLIQHGAKVDSIDTTGKTALHYASTQNNELVAEVLLRAGADLNALTKNRETPLFLSSAFGQFELTSFFLSEGADPDIPNNTRVTPLIFASAGGTPALVTLLLKYGAKRNACDQEGNTALHHACNRGDLEIVKLLLEDKIVNPNIQNSAGFTPLFLNALRGDEDTLDLAALKGQKDILDALLTYGADPEILDANGHTVLHNVYLRGREDLVDFLLDTGQVDINARTNNGETVLSFVCTKSDYNYVPSLFHWDADMNLADDEGRTPLIRAAIAASPKTVQALVDVTADLNAQDITGFTALMHACFARTPETVLALLEAGASTSIRDIDGKTASDLVEAQLAQTLDRNIRTPLKAALDLLTTHATK